MTYRETLKAMFGEDKFKVLKSIEPLFHIAEVQKYVLAPRSEELTEEARVALSLAVERPVRVVLRGPGQIRFRSKHGLLERWDPALGKVGYEFNMKISPFWDSLNEAFRRSHVHSCMETFERVRTTLWLSLKCFLVLALESRWEEAGQLRPLIHLLPKAIPLGEVYAERDLWIVFAELKRGR